MVVRHWGAATRQRRTPHRATYCVSEPLVVRRLLVILGVVFCGLVAVVGRMQSMRVGDVSVMSGLLVIAGFITLGRFTMMMRGALVVIGGGLVMLAALVRLRAHIAVLLLGALTAKRLLPKSDTRVNARPGGVRARGAEMSRGRAVARHSECGYSGMPAL